MSLKEFLIGLASAVVGGLLVLYIHNLLAFLKKIFTPSQGGIVTDKRDGKSYKTIKIGGEWWMAENLNHVTNSSMFYENNLKNAKYGRLYTWNDAMKSCPKGWHIPSDREWKILESHLGVPKNDLNKIDDRGSDEATKMAEGGESGFNALYSGVAVSEKGFHYLGGVTRFWSSTLTQDDDQVVIIRELNHENPQVIYNSLLLHCYISVRCVKNPSFLRKLLLNFRERKKKGPQGDITMNHFTDPRDGAMYKTVKIGKHVWMAENLNFDIDGSWKAEHRLYKEIYGRLYSWNPAVKASPAGWHLPSVTEWQNLIDTLGGEGNAGNRIKTPGNEHWVAMNRGADNSSGFSVLPGGNRFPDGSLEGFALSANFWSSSLKDQNHGIYFFVHHAGSLIANAPMDVSMGFSVRCVRDE